MTESTLKEAKNFTAQMKWCAILCWAASIFIAIKNPQTKDFGWLIIPVAGFVFTVAFFNMRKMIKEYEKSK